MKKPLGMSAIGSIDRDNVLVAPRFKTVDEGVRHNGKRKKTAEWIWCSACKAELSQVFVDTLESERVELMEVLARRRGWLPLPQNSRRDFTRWLCKTCWAEIRSEP